MQTIKIGQPERTLTWELNFGAMRRVKALTGLDLLKPHEPVDDPGARPLQQLLEDPALIASVMQAVGEPAGLTAEDLDTATASQLGFFFEQLIAGWVDFFQQAGQPAKAQLILNHLDLMTKAASKYQETLAQSDLSQVMQDVVKTELHKMIDTIRPTSSAASG